eukprot:5149641-Heterocapsa_arctica.AAC.1
MQHSVTIGHGYIAVHLIDPNQTRAFLQIINCQEYLNEFRIPIRVHYMAIDKGSASGTTRIE